MHPNMRLMECLHVSACTADLCSLNYVFMAKAELSVENISHSDSQSRYITSYSLVQTLDNRMYLIKIKPIPLRRDLIFY